MEEISAKWEAYLVEQMSGDSDTSDGSSGPPPRVEQKDGSQSTSWEAIQTLFNHYWSYTIESSQAYYSISSTSGGCSAAIRS
jgi:hypothetical protein